MGCNKPLIRFYVPHDREASGRVYSLASFNEMHKTKMTYEDLMYRKDVMMIPCGQCTGCRLRKRKDWATRMELEAYGHNKENIWFITLTYDDAFPDVYSTFIDFACFGVLCWYVVIIVR